MNETYTIPLSSIIEEFQLETIYAPENISDVVVVRSDVNRPGLKLSGFGKLFERDRIQIIGRVEWEYLNSLDAKLRRKSFLSLVTENPVCIVFTTELPVSDEQIEDCRSHGVPLLRTKMLTSEFMAAVIAHLNVALAPRVTRHGVLVEVYGEGILMLGDSGVGKS
ncbi:MAG: HPr kinase/phosphorylase, partial [Oscillospiraceae bacterium]|nr:HPr kinase/phosphorylase [Oscillospiraceae bacterium]